MVTLDHLDLVEGLRRMRGGAVLLLLLGVGALVANLADLALLSGALIGGVVAHLLQRVMTLTSKIRQLELRSHEVLERHMRDDE